MKRFKLLLGLGFLSMFLGLDSVNAFSFKDGVNEYVFEEREITCVSSLFPFLIDGDNLIFREGEYDFVKVDKDNKCTNLEGSEILDVLNQEKHRDFVVDENYVVYEEISDVRISGIILTEDTAKVLDKTYYDYNYNVLDNPDFSGNSVYELVSFDYPTSKQLDSTVTYYKRNSNVYEKVDNPVESELYSYLVISDDEEDDYIVKTKMFSLDKTVFEPIFLNGNHPDIVSSLDGVYYIRAYNDDNTMDIYDVKGNLLFDNVKQFLPYNDGLVGIVRDKVVEIYNSSGDLVYTVDELFSLYGLYYKGVMVGYNDDDEFYYNYMVNKLLSDDKVDANNTSNPKTSDNIVVYFISFGLSFIGVVVMFMFYRKIKMLDIG